MSNEKRINGMRIAQLVDGLANSPDQDSKERLRTNWRVFLTESFAISPNQLDWFNGMSAEQERNVGELIEQTLASGGAERLVVAFVPDKSKPAGFYHELRKEAVLETADNMRSNTVIAHCDAHCQNWGWGPG